MLTDADLAEFENALRAWQSALSDASLSTRTDRNIVELDQQAIGRLSRMDALQNQAMANASEGRRRQIASRIEDALQRIANGSYGACLVCDEPIPAGRLRLDPTTPTCVSCASGG